MTPAVLHWALILTAAASNVILNLSLKALSRSVPTGVPLSETLSRILLGPWFWLSGVSGVLLVGCFMLAIRSFSLSLTYTAITALAMVVLTGIGVALQQDEMTIGRGVGLLLIVSGLIVTAWATV